MPAASAVSSDGVLQVIVRATAVEVKAQPETEGKRKPDVHFDNEVSAHVQQQS